MCSGRIYTYVHIYICKKVMGWPTFSCRIFNQTLYSLVIFIPFEREYSIRTKMQTRHLKMILKLFPFGKLSSTSNVKLIITATIQLVEIIIFKEKGSSIYYKVQSFNLKIIYRLLIFIASSVRKSVTILESHFPFD